MPALGVDADRVAGLELAFENLLRKRIFQLLLDSALERTRAVNRIEADVAEQVERLVRQLQRQLALSQALSEVLDLDARDLADLRLVQRAEHDDLVEAVDELRPEVRLHDAHHRRLHLRVLLLAAAAAAAL